MTKFSLNKDQQDLIKSLLNFYKSDEQYYLISGAAGVGKTTCMRHFIQKLNNSKLKIAFSAPTNKAVAVLKDSTKIKEITYRTIYSLLGLKMMPNGGIKELKDIGKNKIQDFDIVVIDEGSMISSVLLEYMESKIALADVKIIIIGDKEQLPPVGEIDSPIWKKYPTNYELTEVMRHQNSILDFVQSIRKNPKPKFVSPGSQVIVSEETDFISKIETIAKAGKFHSGEAKAIAWRNITIDYLNKFIRDSYKTTKTEDTFTEGDRVIFREPIFLGDIPLAATDEEGVILSASVTRHLEYPMLRVWRLVIQLDDGGDEVTALVIHENSQTELNRMLQEFSDSKAWYKFWKLKEAIHDVTHAYALTAHRSQGSTFPVVFVEAGDIMLNSNIRERTKCLYVACSRASRGLIIFP